MSQRLSGENVKQLQDRFSLFYTQFIRNSLIGAATGAGIAILFKRPRIVVTACTGIAGGYTFSTLFHEKIDVPKKD